VRGDQRRRLRGYQCLTGDGAQRDAPDPPTDRSSLGIDR
jgi:hypothetical protein